jgi:hypothetical protein
MMIEKGRRERKQTWTFIGAGPGQHYFVRARLDRSRPVTYGISSASSAIGKSTSGLPRNWSELPDMMFVRQLNADRVVGQDILAIYFAR